MSNRPLTKTEWLAALDELWEAAQQPQRPWVGLTDEEILRADPRFGKSESDVNPYQILGSARDLEAKLKERNT